MCELYRLSQEAVMCVEEQQVSVYSVSVTDSVP